MVVSDLPYRRMTYGDVRDETGALLDRCMAVCFSAAHSYTGEESAEIHCHGSPVVLGEVLRAAFRAGARQARPGEFTQRAFLNGKWTSPRRRRSSTSSTPRLRSAHATPPPSSPARCAADRGGSDDRPAR